MSATSIRIETGYVSPSDLELSWDFTDQGEVYTWTQVKYTAETQFRTVTNLETETYEEGLELARRSVQEFSERVASRMVPVARVNVSEEGGMNFLATCLEPARGMQF